MDLSDRIARAEVLQNSRAYYVLKTAEFAGLTSDVEMTCDYLRRRLPEEQGGPV
jgi:hypothetical protein